MAPIRNRRGCVRCRRQTSSRFYAARPYEKRLGLPLTALEGATVCSSCQRALSKEPVADSRSSATVDRADDLCPVVERGKRYSGLTYTAGRDRAVVLSARYRKYQSTTVSVSARPNVNTLLIDLPTEILCKITGKTAHSHIAHGDFLEM